MAREFRKKNGLPLEACPPQRIPLLGEVLELAKRYCRVRVSIQPKADCVGEIVERIRALNAEDRVGFNDGSREKMSEARRHLPEAPIFLDTSPDGPPLADSIAFARDRGFETIVMNRAEVTAGAVRRVKAAGLQAGAWTVNNLEEACRFAALGVDRFYTDMPVTLLFGLDRQQPRSH
jgi:glycerophosphoryl diester phosphodiesterase